MPTKNSDIPFEHQLKPSEPKFKHKKWFILHCKGLLGSYSKWCNVNTESCNPGVMVSVAGLPKRTWEQRLTVVSLLRKTLPETHKDICLATISLHNRKRKIGRKGGEQERVELGWNLRATALMCQDLEAICFYCNTFCKENLLILIVFTKSRVAL